MKRFRRMLLALTLVVSTLISTISVQAGVGFSGGSGDPTKQGLVAGAWNPNIRLDMLCLGILPIAAESKDKAEQIAKEHMANSYYADSYLYIRCTTFANHWKVHSIGRRTKIHDPKEIENEDKCFEALETAIANDTSHQYIYQEDFASHCEKPDLVSNWIDYMVAGVDDPDGSITTANCYSDKETLDNLIMCVLSCMNGDNMQYMLDDFLTNRNAEGSSTYYVLTIARATAAMSTDFRPGSGTNAAAGYACFDPALWEFSDPWKIGDLGFPPRGFSSFEEFSHEMARREDEEGATIPLGLAQHIFTDGSTGDAVRNGQVYSNHIMERNRTLWLEWNGQYYFGRSYWGWTDGEVSVNSRFTYSAESDPKDTMADLFKTQTGTYRIHLSKTSGIIVPSNKYQVTIEYGNVSRTLESKYNAISLRTVSSGTRTTPAMTVFAGGTVQGASAYLTSGGGSLSSSGNTTTKFTINGTQLKAWCDGTWVPQIQSLSKATNSNHRLLYQPLKITVKIKDLTGGAAITCNPDADNTYNGWQRSTSSNYCSWYGQSDGLDVPWEFHTSYDYKAYAEIVANEVGKGSDGTLNADWNVMQGIPSTENLSIAAGGTLHVTDLSGWVHIRGSTVDAGVSSAGNVGKGVFVPGVIERTIQIQVRLHDTWGTENKPCTLSCPGHTKKIEGNGEGSTKCDACGKTPGYACTNCGEVYGSEWHGVTHNCQNNTTASGVTGTGMITNPVKCGCGGVTLTVKCSDGSSTAPDCTISSSLDLNGNNQCYVGTVSATTKGGKTLTVTVSDPGLLCEGYTVGYGCTHDNQANCVHPEVRYHDFYIKETLDLFAWKEITDGCVYVLSDAEITKIDTNVISDDALGRAASVSTGQSNLWRGRGYQEGNPDPHNMYGRFWYTQFIDKTSANAALGGGCKGVQYTVAIPDSNGIWWPADGDPNDSGYFNSNAAVVLNVTASKKLADAANPGVLDIIPSYSKVDGKNADHFKSTVTSHSTAYKDHEGDYLTQADSQKAALQVVNAWQNAQKDRLFTVTVLSDAFENGSHYSRGMLFDLASGYQNMINSIYSIDDGIKLFNEPFTAVGETHYRNHKSKYSVEELRGMAYGAFGYELHDGNAIVGYIGQPNTDPASKYMYLGDSVAGGKTIPGSIGGTGFIYSAVGDFNGALGGTASGSFYALNETVPAQGTTGNDVSGGAESYYSWATHRHPGGTVCYGWTDHGYDKIVVNCYYRDHEYWYDEKGESVLAVNNETNSALPCVGNYKALVSVTDNGSENIVNYGEPYVISNIDIKDTAPNGVYPEAVEVTCTWRKMIEFHNESTQGMAGYNAIPDRSGNGSDHFSKKAVYSDTYTNVDGKRGVINDIVIHDPVSTEYWGIIGNGYGGYADYVVDESGEDMRLMTAADGSVLDLKESDKNNYLVMGNTFHLWVSDYGDFYDASGSWDNGAARGYRGVGFNRPGSKSDTGESDPNAKGYTDNMNTGIWVKNRYVQFDFPVSYVASDGVTIKSVPSGEKINLSDVKCLTSYGKTDYAVKNFGSLVKGNYTGSLKWLAKNGSPGLFHYGTEALQAFKSDDIEFKYGLDYEFTILPSAVESYGSLVRYSVEAINSMDSDSYRAGINNANRDGRLSAANKLYRDDSVEVVGRIGNLAIEDVGDFRYSELFKQVVDYNSWLIPGAIHRVDSTKPNVIIATKYDILGDDTSKNAVDSSGNLIKLNGKPVKQFNHAQSSITNYIIGSTPGFGKAGSWLPFPLTSSYNPVVEYRDDQMRMGYYAYLDIETIGNYYGINYDVDVVNVPGVGATEVVNTNKLDRGPTSAEDLNDPSKPDRRTYVMDIVPKYFLYDMDDGNFYAINMYYGNQGNRTLFWKNGSEIATDITSLYINMEAEISRRNTTEAERIYTNTLMSEYSESLRASAFDGEDFIGTASRIRLDAFDKSYIGTTIKNGWVQRTGSNLSGSIAGDLYKSIASEWFTNSNFTGNNNDRPPTLRDRDFGNQQQRWYFTLGLPSSTYITYADDSLTNQAKIEQSHEKLMKDHPNSSVVCYLDITVKGTVWTLKYDATAVNGVDDYPDIVPGKEFPKPKNPEDPTPVYGPDGPSKPPVSEIPPEWQPVVVYDPDHTSADDWDTYGTH